MGRYDFVKYREWNDSSICGMALLKSQIGDFIGRSDLEKFFNFMQYCIKLLIFLNF